MITLPSIIPLDYGRTNVSKENSGLCFEYRWDPHKDWIICICIPRTNIVEGFFGHHYLFNSQFNVLTLLKWLNTLRSIESNCSGNLKIIFGQPWGRRVLVFDCFGYEWCRLTQVSSSAWTRGIQTYWNTNLKIICQNCSSWSQRYAHLNIDMRVVPLFF